MDEGSHCDALIAPPPMDFPAGKDEDWELQKSLEAKHREEVRFSNFIVILKIATYLVTFVFEKLVLVLRKKVFTKFFFSLNM